MAHLPPFVREFVRLQNNARVWPDYEAAKGRSCRTLNWRRAGGEVRAFPDDRVKELFDVVTSATELPSFEEVLKVHCG